MTLVTDIRRTVTDNSAVYVAVGVTDLAVEKVRDARDRAAAARVHFSVADLTELPGRVAGQAQQVPTLAFNRTLEIAGKAQESYDDLAERGQKLRQAAAQPEGHPGPPGPGRHDRAPRQGCRHDGPQGCRRDPACGPRDA